MIHEPIVTEKIHHCDPLYKRISWTAIFIGALVALGLGFLLNLFGLAIGLSAISFSDTGQSAIAIGGLLGMLVGVIASMLAAGYTAGYLGRLYCPKRNLGILYGFSTWTLALILGAAIAGPLANYVASSSYITSPKVAVTANNSNEAKNMVSLQTTSSPNSQNTGQKTVNVNAPPSALAWGGISVFLIFFIGAITTCFGACWGMGCKRED